MTNSYWYKWIPIGIDILIKEVTKLRDSRLFKYNK